ncbi:hypothetical protein [Primorskyibacter sedentarius]|nr:hypothetical protein [Primorskyibacter sedentarius]
MELVEAEHTFVYVVHPDFASPVVNFYEKARKIPDLLTMFPGHIIQDVFLVPPGTQVQTSSYQNIKGTRYSLRPPEFTSSVVIQFAGEHPEGALIRSRFWAHGTAPEVLRVEAALFRHMRRTFRNIGGPKVGPTAFAQLLNGRRLTLNVNAPPETDLRAD